MKKSLGIGLLGMGVVGTGVVEVLSQKKDYLESLIGRPLSIEQVLVKDSSKTRSVKLSQDLFTCRYNDILHNEDVDVIIEVIGGEQPAFDFILKAIERGKHVVTANKEVMAKHGTVIMTAAREKGVRVLFEASVAGAIPIIGPLCRDLSANAIINIYGIINGTTNYILTKMDKETLDFNKALSQAKSLGYAEADPSNDVEGIDAAYKLAILSTLAFGRVVKDTDVYCEGITELTTQDFIYAKELGYVIKLLAIASRRENLIQVRVHPAFVRLEEMIGKVDGVLNAIEIETDLAGKVLFSGPGAGPLPTASAIVGDIVDLAIGINEKNGTNVPKRVSNNLEISPITELQTKYYIRLNVADSPGVFAKVCKILGDLEISISSAIQKETQQKIRGAEIVLMTHKAKEISLRRAITVLKGLEVVNSIGSIVRVED